MSVLIIYSGKFPGPSPGAKRIGYYQKGLEAEGIETLIQSVNLRGKGRIAYEIDKLLLPFRAMVAFFKVRKQYKVLFIYGFNWLAYILLALVGKFSGTKVYLEMNEKLGSIYGNRITELGIVKLLHISFHRFSYRFLDGFIVISSALETYLKPYTDKGAQLIIVPIIIDTERQGLGIVAPVTHPYLLHAGALSNRKDGIGEVMDAFAIASKNCNESLHMYFTSKIAPKDLWQKIKQVIEDNNLQDRVHFLGDVAESDLLAYQKHCRMLIINKHVNEQNLHNFPTKLGEYLVLERPVITTGIGELGKYLKDGENAFIVPLHNIQAMAEKIIYVLHHPKESAIVGSRGKETASLYFDYLVQGKRLANFFKENSVR